MLVSPRKEGAFTAAGGLRGCAELWRLGAEVLAGAARTGSEGGLGVGTPAWRLLALG